MEKSIHSLRQIRLQALLRRVRQEAGLTQAQMAERLETHQATVSDYERGERRLDLLELYQVCEAAGITIQEFIERFEQIADVSDSDGELTNGTV